MTLLAITTSMVECMGLNGHGKETLNVHVLAQESGQDPILRSA